MECIKMKKNISFKKRSVKLTPTKEYKSKWIVRKNMFVRMKLKRIDIGSYKITSAGTRGEACSSFMQNKESYWCLIYIWILLEGGHIFKNTSIDSVWISWIDEIRCWVLDERNPRVYFLPLSFGSFKKLLMTYD